jgi:hypothetical protein
MTLRRTLALAALPLLTLTALPASPVGAHAEHGNFVQWKGPSDTEPVSGEEVHIRARLSFGEDGVQSWAVEVVAPPDVADAYPGYGTICESSSSGQAPLAAEVDCVWDTTMYPTGATIAHNGRYLIRITARNGDRRIFSPDPEPHTAERAVRVVNPTSAPRDVKLSVAENNKQATLKWAPNPEPDVIRYVVQEKVGSAEWQTVGETGRKVTTYTRKLAAPGTYRYQVAAVRSTGEGDGTVASAWAAPAGEPKQAVVAEPPKPSTTTTTAPKASKAESGDEPKPHTPEDPAAPAPEGTPAPPAGPVMPDGEQNRSASEAPASGGSGQPALVTPIAPGKPGSVESKQAFSGKVVDNSGKPVKPAPAPKQPRVINQPDGPYSETLPYPKQESPAAPADPNLDTVDAADEEAAIRLPSSDPKEDARAVLVPLAGGLLIFVFAMLGLHVSRRGAAALAEVE